MNHDLFRWSSEREEALSVFADRNDRSLIVIVDALVTLSYSAYFTPEFVQS